MLPDKKGWGNLSAPIYIKKAPKKCKYAFSECSCCLATMMKLLNRGKAPSVCFCFVLPVRKHKKSACK